MSEPPRLPSLPLPGAMTGAPETSWAYDTITRRWPDILARIFAENDLPEGADAALRELGREIPSSPIREIVDPGAPDLWSWNDIVAPYAGAGWLEPPWLFTEHYFYRRIMAAVGYFRGGPGAGLDPFIHQKRQGLRATRRDIVRLVATLDELRALRAGPSALRQLIYIDLWGNQADLSLWPAGETDQPSRGGQGRPNERLLVDDVDRAVDHLMGRPAGRAHVHILVDNAGIELVGDLLLADYLLAEERTGVVSLHLKKHPTYVSDAMAKDVLDTLDFLASDNAAEVRAFGKRLTAHMAAQRLCPVEDFFWNTPKPAWEMPDGLRRRLAEADLVISKGDAHYRRLLGDLEWPPTAAFSEIVAYFPAPLLALRTLKSELVCGLAPGQAESTAHADPAWLTNGRWGLAQLSR